MAPFIIFIILFLCGLLNSYFFKHLPWLLSAVSIPSTPKVVKKEIKKIKERGIIAVAAAGTKEIDFMFATFDRNKDGFITVEELEESLWRLGLCTSTREVVRMVDRVDTNRDGLIDLQEFQKLYESITGDGREKEVELRGAFDVFDGNGDGVITVEELGMVLRSLGLKHGERAEDCRDMIKKVDLDGDGMVDFDEFKEMMVSGGKVF